MLVGGGMGWVLEQGWHRWVFFGLVGIGLIGVQVGEGGSDWGGRRWYGCL